MSSMSSFVHPRTGFGLHLQHPGQLPLEIRLEMEMLISDLGGEPSVAFRRVQEVNKDLRARDSLGVNLGRLWQRLLARSIRRAVFHSTVVLILVGFTMVLVALTNPTAVSMATGVAMIAIASFAGL